MVSLNYSDVPVHASFGLSLRVGTVSSDRAVVAESADRPYERTTLLLQGSPFFVSARRWRSFGRIMGKRPRSMLLGHGIGCCVMEEDQREPEYLNFTPHEIVVISRGGERRHFPPARVFRVDREVVRSTEAAGIQIDSARFLRAEGLPDPRPGTIYIVSLLTLIQFGRGRPDVVAPDTGVSAERDEQGRITAVRSFLQLVD